MGEVIIPEKFLPYVNDYMEPIIIYGDLYQIAKYFSNVKIYVVGLGKIFAQRKFSGVQVYTISCEKVSYSSI